MTDCPECNKPLAEADRSCANCGWPHEEQVEQTSEAGSVSATPKPMVYLAAGLGIGLVIGFVVGTSFSGGQPPAEEARASDDNAASAAVAPIPPPPPAPAGPVPLRLRELSWKQSSEKLCTGRFEVVSAPASVRVLKFAVTDAEGKVIGNDAVSAAKPVKPGTVLELGFEVGKCSAINTWRVEVPEIK